MKISTANIIAATLLSLGAVSCTTVSNSKIANEATAQSYAESAAKKGVVILAVNWGRRWGCGNFENAQIVSFGFDRLPIQNASDNSRADLLLNAPGGRLFVDPVFLDYAVLVEPGEYALTSFDIMAARSTTDVGHFVATRSDLLENGKPKAGSFEVKAGEVVYIGNFWLDCQGQPTLWRYYTKGREGFKSHMAEVRQKYPFIDPNKVTFRLFRTKNLGSDYELPQN